MRKEEGKKKKKMHFLVYGLFGCRENDGKFGIFAKLICKASKSSNLQNFLSFSYIFSLCPNVLFGRIFFFPSSSLDYCISLGMPSIPVNAFGSKFHSEVFDSSKAYKIIELSVFEYQIWNNCIFRYDNQQKRFSSFKPYKFIWINSFL